MWRCCQPNNNFSPLEADRAGEIDAYPASGFHSAKAAGDLDKISLADAINHGTDLEAKVLVFPGHGGSPGGDVAAFVERLIGRVAPATVIFPVAKQI